MERQGDACSKLVMEMIAPVDMPYNTSQSTVSADVHPLGLNSRDQWGLGRL